MALQIDILSARGEKRTKADGSETVAVKEISYRYSDPDLGPKVIETAMRIKELEGIDVAVTVHVDTLKFLDTDNRV